MSINKKTLSAGEIAQLTELSRQMRVDILRMITDAKGSHIAPAFSMVELMVVLYKKILRIDPKQPLAPDRDRFLLSKGHGSAALYVSLADAGFFPKEELKTFVQPGSRLGGHPEMQKAPGIEITAGSLGHGLPIANGIALFGKMSGATFKTYCMLSDGECQEGSTYEAALFGAQHQLENLTAIIDNNSLQIGGPTKEILNIDPLAPKWEALGWHVVEVDGHNIEEIYEALQAAAVPNGKPKVIVAHTIKGKGVSFMENQRQWHSMLPNPEELALAFKELDEAKA